MPQTALFNPLELMSPFGITLPTPPVIPTAEELLAAFLSAKNASVLSKELKPEFTQFLNEYLEAAQEEVRAFQKNVSGFLQGMSTSSEKKELHDIDSRISNF
jgi:hypothetical protein